MIVITRKNERRLGHGNLCVQTTAWAFGAMIAISVAWFVLTQAIHNSINPGGAKPDGTQAFIIINALLPMVLLEKNWTKNLPEQD